MPRSCPPRPAKKGTGLSILSVSSIGPCPNSLCEPSWGWSPCGPVCIKECGKTLKHLMQNRIKSLERQSIVYPGKADIILWHKEKPNQLMEHQTSLNSQEVDTTFGTEVQCPQCQVLVSSLSALKTHFATKHGVSLIAAESLTLQSQRSIDIAEHSVDGAPVCRHCRHSFRKWQSHIATHCPVLHNCAQCDVKPGLTHPAKCPLDAHTGPR